MKKPQTIIDIEQQAAMKADGFAGNLAVLIEREKLLREKEELKADYSIYPSEYGDALRDSKTMLIYSKNKK